MKHTRARGFTLVEILIVVVILGLLAGVVLAQFRDTTREAGQTAFFSAGRIFGDAAVRFYLERGVYPEDAGSGVLPTDFGNYVMHT